MTKIWKTTMIAVIATFIPMVAMSDEKSKIDNKLKEKGIYKKVLDTDEHLEFEDIGLSDLHVDRLSNLVRENFFANNLDFSAKSSGQSDRFAYAFDPQKSKLMVGKRKQIYDDEIPEQNMTHEEIKELARQDLDVVGIEHTDDQNMGYRVHRLIAGSRAIMDSNESMPSENKVETKAIAFKVRVTRKIKNKRLWGPKMTLTYDLDGQINKFKMTWPKIDKGSHKIRSSKTKKEILDRVHQKIVQKKLGKKENQEQNEKKRKNDFEVRYVLENGKIKQKLAIINKLEDSEQIGETIVELVDL